MAGQVAYQQIHDSSVVWQSAGKTEGSDSGVVMEGKESVGENGKTISCLQFAGNCAEALEIYKVCCRNGAAPA